MFSANSHGSGKHELKIIYFSSEPFHPADVDSLNDGKAVSEIKHDVVENIASLHSIIVAKITQLTENTCSQLPCLSD